jgi:Plant mobile domain
MNKLLITTLVERWRPKTFMFHLPVDEMIITLEDIYYLWRLIIRRILLFYIFIFNYPLNFTNIFLKYEKYNKMDSQSHWMNKNNKISK